MYLRRLTLRNYRNFIEQTYITNANISVIYGRNAQGKTNLLESIYLLGNYKSFRTQRNSELIRNNTAKAEIHALIATGGVEHHITMSIDRDSKNITVDGKKSITPEKISGLLRPVLFSPEEIGIINGPPAERRALIDRAIFHTNPEFLILARKFNRVLRQRNKILRTDAQAQELKIWSEYLVQYGAAIRDERKKYVTRLVPRLKKIYQQIVCDRPDERENIDLIINEGDDIHSANQLRDELDRVLEREKIHKTTLAGPQRDDPLFKIDGRLLRQFGSQGQKKSYILAFKIAQIEDLEKQFGVPPLLLLDDFAGELDFGRRQFLFEYLCQHRGQVFITTTDKNILSNTIFHDVDYYCVDQGILSRD
ncbi:MAG: DNA replication/repair protein RecF [Desulfuromonadales bacterium]|nr:DNA replication/repair protein RecF [Desulfuromonadales bacterium]